MTQVTRPDRNEVAEYYLKYLDLVPDADICTTLEAQLTDTLALLESVPSERVDYRYAPDKWSTREVLSHVNDNERVFAFRAFWFARGFESPLPSFDQEIAAGQAAAASRPWNSHVEEFRSIRSSTLHFFRGLPPDAWLRRGIASGNPFTVRALAYLTAGHVTHHTRILRERYLPGPT
ncbi:MAG: DinB family protein [Acidobacteria bacterium]|nr:MAG: DinB family protein [Acidobacteriota bacterium]